MNWRRVIDRLRRWAHTEGAWWFFVGANVAAWLILLMLILFDGIE